jgi:hypothetical protein
MAKLLSLSRPSKRVGNAVRAWWAMRSQKRRRQRAATPLVVPAPLLTGVQVLWDESTVGWADVIVSISFNDAGWPAGTFEIFVAPGPGGTAFESSDEISSSARSFRQNMVFNDQNGVTYQLRYRNSEVIGPFSNSIDANIST